MLKSVVTISDCREFSKDGQKDTRVIADTLSQLSLPAGLIEAFVTVSEFCDAVDFSVNKSFQTFGNNRSRISQVKGNLALSGLRFKDLSWRLDVEVR